MARTIPKTPYICIPDDFESPISDYMSCPCSDDELRENSLERTAGRNLEEQPERPLEELPGRPLEEPPGRTLEESLERPLKEPFEGSLEVPPEGPLEEPLWGPLNEPPRGPLNEPPGGPLKEPPGGYLKEPPGGSLKEPPGGSLKEPPGGPLKEPPGGPLKEPPGGPLEEPPGGKLQEPPGGTLEKPPGRVLEEPLSNLVEDESFSELTAALPLGENLENNDLNICIIENKTSQKKRSLSQSDSQRKCKESTSKKRIKRQRKKSDNFPVHVICTKKGEVESRTYPSSYINFSSKRKLPSSASESERETKKQSKQTLENSNVLEKHATSKCDEPSTSKMNFDESRMSCDDQDIPNVSEAHSVEAACSTLRSSQLSPEVTNSTSTKEFPEKDLKSCSSQNANETAKIQYIKGCESSNSLSADDEDDDVQKTYFLSNAFVRRHKNSDHLSRESSDSPEEGHSNTAVQFSKNNLKPFQSLKKRKKELDREKSSEDSGYQIKIKHLRKMMRHVLPNTKAQKQNPKKLLECSPEASEEISCSLDSDDSFSSLMSRKYHDSENSANEISESEVSLMSDEDLDEILDSETSNTNESISSDNSLLSEESSDHTLIYLSNEENPEEDQCVPKGTPITIEEKSSGSNVDRSPISTVSRMVRNNENVSLISFIEQSPERYLANISEESKSEEDQCVPSGSPIKITNEKSASPIGDRNSINSESRTGHFSANISSNITTENEQSLINISNEMTSEEEQCVLRSEEGHEEMNMKGDECNAVSQIEIAIARRRNAISRLVSMFCANHPWRERVFNWVRSVYPDLVSDDREPEPVTADPVPDSVSADPVSDSASADPVSDSASADPVSDSASADPVSDSASADPDPNLTADQPELPNVNLENMQSDEYYVDSIGNTLAVASETFVSDRDRVDENDDQLYCRNPQPCPSPTNLSADDELTDSES